MKRVLTIITVALTIVFLPPFGHARSAEMIDGNISKAIEISLKQTKLQSEACKAARRSVSNKCGSSYIYPMLSQHPQREVGEKINTFIQELEVKSANTFARIESWTEVTLNKENILSLSYSGQIYGQSNNKEKNISTCSNLDLETGDEIVLEDVLKPGYQETLPRLIFENLDLKLQYRLPGYLRSVLRLKGTDWKLGNDQSFSLREKDLTLCFDQGVLSDKTIGPVAIPVPYALVSNLIDEKGPLAFVLDQENSIAKPKIQPIEKLAAPSQPVPESNPVSDSETRQEKIEEQGNRVGSTDYLCFKDETTHTISVVEYDEASPFICAVHYDKTYEQKILWRSRKTKSFCDSNASKLVSKYEDQWGYTCGRSTER